VNNEKTHYEILGLAPDSTPEQVKKRFRELARKYHPDVNPDHPETTQLFLRINEAYEVLRDPSRRASYDLILRDKARQDAFRRPSASTSSSSNSQRTSSTNGGHRKDSKGWVNGGSSTSRQPKSSPRARQEAERRRQEMARLLEAARQSYSRGYLREAQRLCRQALERGSSGSAHELMGDIYDRQGRADEAIKHYTMAAQVSPNNSRIMGKFNRAAAERKGGGAFSHHPHHGYPSGHRNPGVVPPKNHLSYQMAVSFFGLAVIVFLLMWRPAIDDARLMWPVVGNWTLSHLSFMALDGLVCGAVLASAAWIRPIDRELFYQFLGSQRLPVPTGVLLAALSLVFMPLSLAAYGAIAYIQETASNSVLLIYGAAFFLTFGFVMVAPPDAWIETLLFGGNVLFVTMLCGWFIGDLFRPDWAMQ
jgi:curved DNA-binding protein CbpA